ncbi:endonuclease/exonuclease/phosphatase family protein [Nesterenkonia flava]|uniref:Endonuclease/exonuclease/phosphatase family protein n=1 Tax=Nesterenkonia flava TaxID=469799 RepID=A0ABU1FVQ5_9MICC|nr:endonuclease/exonuclease/phosphatase family protein [Nesterenkonia flava]MDR5712759.1 endonuclease/exonuclease/phosphatase family protein [Nesterenkonia flava]
MDTNRPQDSLSLGSSSLDAASLDETVRSVTESSANISASAEELFTQAQRHMRTIKVFSWNLWYGGREIDDALTKQQAVLQHEDIDILFVQECFGGAGLRLGRVAGMTVAQQDYDCAVLSPSPIRLLSTDTAPFATAALVQTRLGEVLAWSVHLAPWDYGPYRAASLPEDAETVFSQRGEQMRTEEAAKILSETDRILAELGELPVIIAGDFNVPSGLDWNGVGQPQTAWPATQAFMDAGFTDAFRSAHPYPAKAPGLTWSQIEPREAEPRDRIDFIYARGLDVVAGT